MVAIGTRAGLRTRAVLTAMEAPLGLAVGNALEVIEAIETLKGRGPDDFRELCLLLSAHLLVVAGLAPDLDAARRTLDGRGGVGRRARSFPSAHRAPGRRCGRRRRLRTLCATGARRAPRVAGSGRMSPR